MKSIRLIIILLLFGAVCIARDSADDNNKLSDEAGDKFLNRVSAELQKIKTLQSGFTQERHLSMLMTPLISKGRLYFNKPDQLRWEVYESYRSILIYNDGQVAKFDFNNGKLRKLQMGAAEIMGEVLKQITFWMSGDFGNSAEVYDISIFKNDGYLLQLTPKSEELAESIQSIDLHIDRQTLHINRVKITETEFDYIEIKFSDEKINQTFDQQIFDLNEPLMLSGAPSQ